MAERVTSAFQIVRTLGGRWAGRHGTCRCPAHKSTGKTPPLSVTETSDGRVLVHCFAGCPQGDVIDALRGLGLWSGEAVGDPSYPGRLTSPADGLKEKSDRERRQFALDIWDARRAPAGTPAEAYLRARGIRLPLSTEIGFHPSLKHAEARRALPAMLGRISDRRGFCAVQRTWLKDDGSAKADVKPAKMTLGPMGEGAVRLFPPRDLLGLAEGIETALSAMQLYSLPVWATLSANRLSRINIPDHVRQLVIFGDAGEVGWREAEAAAAVYEARDLSVEIVMPAAHFAKAKADDFNTVLRGAV